MFKPIDELTTIVNEINGQVPTDIIDYLEEKDDLLKLNNITEQIHVGRTEWNRTQAAEWLLGQFRGIVRTGKEDERYFNSFGHWLAHVNHFVIENKAGLKDE